MKNMYSVRLYIIELDTNGWLIKLIEKENILVCTYSEKEAIEEVKQVFLEYPLYRCQQCYFIASIVIP